MCARVPIATAAVALVLLGFAAAAARAADPQPYSVTFSSTHHRPLDAALKASSDLESLRKSAPVSPFALVGRAQQDIGRMLTVLQSFGYYLCQVTITINGRSLDDPDLPDSLTALPSGKEAAVLVTIDTGTLFRLRQVSIDGSVNDSARAALKLNPGVPAVAADVLEGGARLLNALQEQGYAFAKVDTPVADVDPDAHVIDVTFHVNAGARARVGQINITGLRAVHAAVVQKRLLIHSGELYSPSKVEQTRQELLALGVFSGVTARLADKPDADGRVTITFEMQERLRHSLGFTAAYSSDLGGSVGVTWSDHNLFGSAQQLNLSASATNIGGAIGGTDTTGGLGYNTTAQLVEPDFHARDQSLQFNVGTLKQQLEAYDQTAVTEGTVLSRKFSNVWTAAVGVTLERERILQEGTTYWYSLLSAPLTVTFNSTGLANPLEDARRGFRAAVSIAPTESLGSAHATFIVSQMNASSYLDLNELGWGDPGRTVLAVRGLLGKAEGASQYSLPPDQRFYAGGSATVRGYKYQIAGPLYPDNNPEGGTTIDAAGAEVRERLTAHFGIVAFGDVGAAGIGRAPLESTQFIGVGLGGRYYTPIGPIRLDVAFPMKHQPGNDPFELYIGLGQAF